MVLVSAMHITAGVYVNDAEYGLIEDIDIWVEELAPFDINYNHHNTGETNGDSHLKSLLIGHEVTVPITNGKLDYINKVPHEYLSYYFTQMLVSFVSNRIKEEQQKVGISFQKCNALVREIADEYYKPVSHMDKSYVKSNLASGNVWINNLEDAVKYLSHYPITEETKQYKPIVKLAVEEVLIAADAYVSIDSLVNAVYGLLDQSSFSVNVDESETENSCDGKYDSAIAKILEGIDSTDAHIFLNYVFGDEQKMSLSEIAIKYNVPKSSVHKKIEDFKNKIFKVYMPENEDDGICFLQNLAQSLDDLAK
jgi:hypothetical protein